MTTQYKSADKTSGHLLRTFDPSNQIVFRVYNNDGTFIDYDIHHCDLHITINDKDAYFYSSDGLDRLDHSPETLGLK